jgi:hypothetical protein
VTTGKDLRRVALSLEGTSEAPHFDRAAFKVARIYVTLAADGHTANYKFTPDEQEFKCLMAPEAFWPVPNAWGKQDNRQSVEARRCRTQAGDRDRMGARSSEEIHETKASMIQDYGR